MNYYEAMKVSAILIFLGMLIYIMRHTYVHEIGHVLTIRLFNIKTKVGVVLNKRISIKWGLHKRHINQKKLEYDVFINKFKKGLTAQAGQTLTEENYKEFTVEQLRVIARGGVIAQMFYGGLLGIIMGVLCKLISISCSLSTLYSLFTFTCVLIIPLLDSIYTVLKKIEKNNNEWPDNKIWKNPDGFYNYIRNNNIKGITKYQEFFTSKNI